MTGAQLREARRLLGWSLDTLGAACNISGQVLLTFEKTGRLAKPFRGSMPVDRNAVLTAVLEAAGVVFTDGEEPGVKLRKAEG